MVAAGKPDPNKLYLAKETYLNARGDQITAGVTLLWGSDPIVRSHPDFFVLSDLNRPDVEDASAAPGKKRGAA